MNSQSLHDDTSKTAIEHLTQDVMSKNKRIIELESKIKTFPIREIFTKDSAVGCISTLIRCYKKIIFLYECGFKTRSKRSIRQK